MSHLAVNRSLGDVIPATIAYAKATVTAIERRLTNIDALTARLRRERIIPESPVASRIHDCESHLSMQLDLTIRQLELLQARRQ